jgi:DNA-binding transcriptional ArsR family regulator
MSVRSNLEPVVLDDAKRVAAILAPLRRRILESFDEPRSAVALARHLGLPRQRINYHLRALETAGFLELAETRQRRGCVERCLRMTARAYLVSPALLGRLSADPEEVRDRFSSTYLVATAARVMRDVSVLRKRAARAGKGLATLTLQSDITFATPTDRAAFAEGLGAALARLAAKYHTDSPGGRRFRIVVAGHPVITRNDEDDRTERGRKEAP